MDDESVDAFYLLRRSDGAYATIDLRDGPGLLVFTSLELAAQFRATLHSGEEYREVGLDAPDLSELLGEIDGVSYVLRDPDPEVFGASDSVLDFDPEPLSPDDTRILDGTVILRRPVE